jgi:hypothetical protein
MVEAKRMRDDRHDRHCGRSEPQVPDQALAHLGEVLGQRILIGEDALGPLQHAIALPAQPSETLSLALDERDTQLMLELADRL